MAADFCIAQIFSLLCLACDGCIQDCSTLSKLTSLPGRPSVEMASIHRLTQLSLLAVHVIIIIRSNVSPSTYCMSSALSSSVLGKSSCPGLPTSASRSAPTS